MFRNDCARVGIVRSNAECVDQFVNADALFFFPSNPILSFYPERKVGRGNV